MTTQRPNRKSGRYAATKIHLTYLILRLNGLIDAELHRDVTVEEAREHIRRGDVFAWLKDKYGRDFDASPLVYDTAVADDIVEGLQNLLGGYEGDEGRKWGVRNNGICLVLAWVNELLQLDEHQEKERYAA